MRPLFTEIFSEFISPFTEQELDSIFQNDFPTPSAPAQQEYEIENEDLPPDFMCPISCEVIRDPVMAADNHSYERATITAWLKDHNTSPLTREVLANKELRPNYALKKVIEYWLQTQFEENRLHQNSGYIGDIF